MQPLNLLGPNAKRILERDQAVIAPCYPRIYPFVMDHGRGVEVWDVDNNRFLDFAAGIAVVSTVHSHPQVVQAIKEQADKFLHISSDFYHPKWVELGEKLNQITPFKENAVSFMPNSGTESVEAAIKLARYYTGKTAFIGFFGGFHGRTMGAVTFTASKNANHKGFFPLLNGVYHIAYPDPYRPVLQSLPGEDYGETVARYIEEEIMGRILPPDKVAGILVEPIRGEGGYIVPAPGFFPALRKLCEYDILLIADEVQSGVGRTGKWWAIQNFDAEPDIICIAKGIASGMPMGAMVARKHIATWPRGSHGNTFGGNPLACAATLATLELIENEYMENAACIGSYALSRSGQMMENHPSIGMVRGIGLMIGIEFVESRESKKPAESLRNQIVQLAFERGLLTLGCSKSTLRISPPLCITKKEMDEGLDTLEEAITLAEENINHATRFSRSSA